MIAETKKVDALLPGTYQSALNWSIFHFLQGDLQTARKILGSWSSHPDGTWALNIAFLYLYEGKTREANRYYQIAFRRNLESNTVLEVEEFMEWCLKDDKSKVQLNYGLGMVNYVLKEEPEIARDYFERFLDEIRPGQYKEAAVQATKYLEDIRKKKPARIKKIR